MLWLCYKLPPGLFGNIRDTSFMHEKVKLVCFNHMQPQKVKFKSVQINMKHVSYMVKPFKYLLLWNQKANGLDLVCSFGDVVPTRFAPMIILG